MLIHCTLSRNSAKFGGGIYSVEATPVLANCILWGNSSTKGRDEEAQIYMDGGELDVSYCCIQGWTGRHSGPANSHLDPLFVDDDGKDNTAGTEDDNLTLLRTSPCIDTGDSNAVPSDALDLDSNGDFQELISFDHAGNPRVCNGVVDRGAFEFCSVFFPGPVIYVDAHAATPGDGTSWSTALVSLQQALQIATEYSTVREIRVAAGVYTSAEPNGPREATFQLVNNVAIRGGYAGHGRSDPRSPHIITDPNTRDIGAWETILSGDLNHDDAEVADPCDLLAEPNRSDNSCHIVTGSGTDATAVLDGFTITGGTANGMYDEDGGGIYIMAGSPTIVRCILQGNAAQSDGGGIYCLFGDPNIRACTISDNCAGMGGGVFCAASSPSIIDSTIADNYSIGDGAGIVCDYLSSPLIARNTIRGNKTHLHGGGVCCLSGADPRILHNTIITNVAHDGGGVYCLNAHPTVANNMVIGNTAGDDGGGVCAVEGSRPVICNNTIVRNRANPQGGGVFFENAQATVTNCILWENGDDFHNCTPVYDCNATYSCIQDGGAGERNISIYPHFRDPQNGDYHLKPYSPCIDAGYTSMEMLLPGETDFDGDRRVQFLLVDIGADETPSWKRFLDADENGLPDGWEKEHFEHTPVAPDEDPDDDGYTNRDECERGTNPLTAQSLIVYVSSVNNSDPQPDGFLAHPFTSIQQAIDEVRDGGQILVTEGTFHERLIIDGKTVFIQGGYNLAFTRIERYTVLTADGQGRGVLYINVPDGMLSGFIITDGFEMDGGGMYFLNSSPTVRDNIIMGNAAVDDGGGISFYFGAMPLFEDNVVADNYVGDNAGGIYCREASPRIHRCLITGNMAEDGGAMRLRHAVPSIVDCIITGNMATDEGGAIVCREGASPFIQGCTISNNHAGGKGAGLAISEGSDVTICDSILHGNVRQAVWADKATIRIAGVVETLASDWKARDLVILGEGDLRVGTGDVLQMDNCSLRCNLTGRGNIQVELESELVIEGNARVELGHPTEPQENGVIECDGLLHVRGSAQLTGATIRVTRASFEGDVDITNSVIEAEAGVPYGQFFVADTVRITGSDIHADGDRYIDLDPKVFDGLIANNRIFVTGAEGVGHTRGGLFELRGQPGLAEPVLCDPNNPVFCRVARVPDFNPASWMIEELRLVEGAKLNLTNRFDFQPPYGEGGEEVLYVRNLYLGKDSVLNTCFNRIYYENLFTDPCATVVSVPLLGFSLNNIAFDNQNEFVTRIRHNNVVDPDRPRRIHVARVTGEEPDPNGVMRMCCLADTETTSPTFGQAVSARAKGLFAKSNEAQIQVRFEYLFCDPAGAGELIVYLTDHPELLAPDDPNRALHYVEVARLLHPPSGRPGSAGSGRWGLFEQVVHVQHLNFIRGTRIELELIGPAGTAALINNFDPAVRCLQYCGDIAGIPDMGHLVDAVDFLAALTECGRRIDDVETTGAFGAWCLDGFFCRDGYDTIHDAMAVDWIAKKGLCPDELIAADLDPAAYAYYARTTAAAATRAGLKSALPVASTETQGIASVQEIPGQFLVAAKRYEHRAGQSTDLLSDRLYGLDRGGNLVGGAIAMANDRLNGKLVRDHNGTLYQLNLELGLVRIADNERILSPRGLSVGSEPRYRGPADVYIGFQETDNASWGRPLLDAAFDAEGYVYVVPVVVAPDLGIPYLAAAKLALTGASQSPEYRLERLFDHCPPPNDNLVTTQVREVEVDSAGYVYVLNCHHADSDILWIYQSDGQLAGRREFKDIEISAPVGLCVSSYDPSMLYLASSENPPDANTVKLYVLSSQDLSLTKTIEIGNMGHITDVTEDPADGTVCIVGFQMPVIPSESRMQDLRVLSEPPFYQPRFATIRFGDSGPIEAVSPNEAGAGNDMALPLSVICVEGTAGGRQEQW